MFRDVQGGSNTIFHQAGPPSCPNVSPHDEDPERKLSLDLGRVSFSAWRSWICWFAKLSLPLSYGHICSSQSWRIHMLTNMDLSTCRRGTYVHALGLSNGYHVLPSPNCCGLAHPQTANFLRCTECTVYGQLEGSLIVGLRIMRWLQKRLRWLSNSNATVPVGIVLNIVQHALTVSQQHLFNLQIQPIQTYMHSNFSQNDRHCHHHHH